MLAAGAEPNVAVGEERLTPLHMAASFDYEITKLLIDAGAYKNTRDRNGRRPFNEALARWDIPTMELLF